MQSILQLLLFLLVSLSFQNKTSANEDAKRYLSVTIQPSKFSKESYFSEMQDIVQIQDGQAIAIEASPGDIKGMDIDLGALINSKNEEDKIEGIYGSLSFGGWFTRVEKGSSSGVFGTEGFEEYTRPLNKNFENEYTYLVLAKYMANSISFGFGYYKQTMPGYFYLTYENGASGSQPEKIIDPNYELKIIGGMFTVDSMKSLLRDDNAPFASFIINTPKTKLFYGLSMEMLTGLGFTSASDGVKTELKDEYNVIVEDGMDTRTGWGLFIQMAVEMGYLHRAGSWDIGLVAGYSFRELASMYLGSTNFDDPTGGSNHATAEDGAGDFLIIHGLFLRGLINF